MYQIFLRKGEYLLNLLLQKEFLGKITQVPDIF
jgi:hypothetical protein